MELACSLRELDAAGGVRPVALGAREILVVRDGDAVRAVDRRCPHEGFPLDRATRRGGVLECPAHGWRFDLATGGCLGVGQPLRTYEVEVRDDGVFVDVDVPPSDEELAFASEALISAIELGRAPLAGRRAARLLALGASPDAVALLLARYGATHGDGALDPTVVGVADAVALAGSLAPSGVRIVFADVAIGLAERLQGAPPRFGPEPATPFAWSSAGVASTIAAQLRGGDGTATEAVIAGMIAAGVPTGAIVDALVAATIEEPDGPWPLLAVHACARLVDRFGDEIARPLLPVVGFGCTSGPSLAEPADGPARSSGLLADAASALLAFDRRDEEDPASGASLLTCGLVLAWAYALAWAEDRIGVDAGRAARSARTMLAAARGSGGGPDGAEEPDRSGLAAAVAAGVAETSLGVVVCLAVAAAAVERDDPQLRAAATRLLATPRRERATARLVAGHVAPWLDDRTRL